MEVKIEVVSNYPHKGSVNIVNDSNAIIHSIPCWVQIKKGLVSALMEAMDLTLCKKHNDPS